jgi:hypothetical protein
MQSILLPKADIAVLRAAIALPLFAPLLEAVPGLVAGLRHPQPDFGPYLPLVDDAVGEVRSNTNYPEDWDDLSEAVDGARQARGKFLASLDTAQQAAAPQTLQVFILVEETMGSNDGASFGKQAYVNFPDACAALKSQAEADFDPLIDDDLTLSEYGSIDTFSYGLNLLTKHRSVVRQYFVKKFDLATDLTALAGVKA